MTELEWKTRRERVDPKLRAAGWDIVKFESVGGHEASSKQAITEYPTDAGPADYMLCDGGRPLAVVEAKKVTLGPQGVLTQAERYSKGFPDGPFNFDGYRVPFLYSTNGEVIWFQDARHELNLARRVSAFHTPAALQELLSRDFEGACTWLEQNPPQHERLRPYQLDANGAVEGAIRTRKRQMLVAMATGTGKTYTLVNQIYRLTPMVRRPRSSSRRTDQHFGRSNLELHHEEGYRRISQLSRMRIRQAS